jgi:hypothetical protein
MQLYLELQIKLLRFHEDLLVAIWFQEKLIVYWSCFVSEGNENEAESDTETNAGICHNNKSITSYCFIII